MSLRRIRAVAKKEFLHILRDVRSLAMALALPLLMLLLFGYALTLDVDRIPTAVYDANESPQSRELIERFHSSRFFRIIGSEQNYKGVEDKINSGKCLLAIVVPHDYARDLLSGRQAHIQLLLDGSDSNTASIALGYANSVVQNYSARLVGEARQRRGAGVKGPPVETRLRVWYNSELKSKNYIVPGLIGLIMIIIASLLTSLTVAREWEMGTMEQLLSTPVRPQEIVLGKIAAFFTIGIADMLIAVVTGIAVFKVPFRGSTLFLGVTALVFLLGALCWGILISALARSQLLAYQMGMLTSFLPAFLLSGFIFSIENMPVPVQIVTFIFPARYMVTILKGVFLRGVGFEVLWVEVAFLVGYTVLVYLVATRKLQQKVA